MVQLPEANFTCEKTRQKCLCMARETKDSGLRLVSNPINKRHLFYCAGQVSLCSVAWASVALGKVYPTLERWKGPIVAACYTGHQALKEFEENNSVS